VVVLISSSSPGSVPGTGRCTKRRGAEGFSSHLDDTRRVDDPKKNIKKTNSDWKMDRKIYFCKRVKIAMI
jgi:hypothetical protein